MTADEDSLKKQSRNQGIHFTFVYGYKPCVVNLHFLNPISIRHSFLIYFWSETVHLNIWNFHKYFSLDLTDSYIDSVVFFH